MLGVAKVEKVEVVFVPAGVIGTVFVGRGWWTTLLCPVRVEDGWKVDKAELWVAEDVLARVVELEKAGGADVKRVWREGAKVTLARYKRPKTSIVERWLDGQLR
jgi:hypothetical protein